MDSTKKSSSLMNSTQSGIDLKIGVSLFPTEAFNVCYLYMKEEKHRSSYCSSVDTCDCGKVIRTHSSDGFCCGKSACNNSAGSSIDIRCGSVYMRNSSGHSCNGSCNTITTLTHSLILACLCGRCLPNHPSKHLPLLGFSVSFCRAHL